MAEPPDFWPELEQKLHNFWLQPKRPAPAPQLWYMYMYMYRVRSVINDTQQNVYIYLCNKDRELCLVSFQSFTNRLSAYTTLRYIQQEPKASEGAEGWKGMLVSRAERIL